MSKYGNPATLSRSCVGFGAARVQWRLSTEHPAPSVSSCVHQISSASTCVGHMLPDGAHDGNGPLQPIRCLPTSATTTFPQVPHWQDREEESEGQQSVVEEEEAQGHSSGSPAARGIKDKQQAGMLQASARGSVEWPPHVAATVQARGPLSKEARRLASGPLHTMPLGACAHMHSTHTSRH